MADINSVVENILNGMEVKTAVTESEDDANQAKPVVQKFLQEKHFIDGFVKGSKIEPTEAGFDVLLDLVPEQTLEKWLFENMTRQLSQEFHWGGNTKCEMEKTGTTLKIKCRGTVTW